MTRPLDSLSAEDLLADMRWLRRFAARLARDDEDVDDLTQEAWAKALQRAPADVDRAGLRAWLARVVRHARFRRWRDDDLRRHHEARGARADAVEELGLERLELQHRLAGMLLELGEPARTAVVLRYQQELSYAEISARLGIEPEAARKRVSRGLGELRARLERELGAGIAWRAALERLAGPPDAGRAAPASAWRRMPWLALPALALGAVVAARMALDGRDGEPLPARDLAGGGPLRDADAHAAVAELAPFLGRFDPPPGAPDATGESVELAPGPLPATLVLRQRVRDPAGVERLATEALVGWHPGVGQLVYHEFQASTEHAVMFEGTLWREGEDLLREYLAYAPDGSSRAYRERWRLDAAGCVRRIEYEDDDGRWVHWIDAPLVRAEDR